MRRLLAALVIAAAPGAGVAATAAAGPAPASAERAIVARFPTSKRFYFPSSLPAVYQFKRWVAVNVGGRYARDVFRIEFAPRGKTFAGQLQANGTWATWVGYRSTKPCKQIYYGGWSHASINGRNVYYVTTAGNGKGAQTASICGSGYAADLTLNRAPLSRARLMRLVAFARVVTR